MCFVHAITVGSCFDDTQRFNRFGIAAESHKTDRAIVLCLRHKSPLRCDLQVGIPTRESKSWVVSLEVSFVSLAIHGVGWIDAKRLLDFGDLLRWHDASHALRRHALRMHRRRHGRLHEFWHNGRSSWRGWRLVDMRVDGAPP